VKILKRETRDKEIKYYQKLRKFTMKTVTYLAFQYLKDFTVKEIYV